MAQRAAPRVKLDKQGWWKITPAIKKVYERGLREAFTSLAKVEQNKDWLMALHHLNEAGFGLIHDEDGATLQVMKDEWIAHTWYAYPQRTLQMLNISTILQQLPSLEGDKLLRMYFRQVAEKIQENPRLTNLVVRLILVVLENNPSVDANDRLYDFAELLMTDLN